MWSTLALGWGMLIISSTSTTGPSTIWMSSPLWHLWSTRDMLITSLTSPPSAIWMNSPLRHLLTSWGSWRSRNKGSVLCHWHFFFQEVRRHLRRSQGVLIVLWIIFHTYMLEWWDIYFPWIKYQQLGYFVYLHGDACEGYVVITWFCCCDEQNKGTKRVPPLSS